MPTIDSRNDPTLRRLVNRVLWPGFNGTTVPDWLARALDEGLGGVLYFAQNLDGTDPRQPARLSGEIHAMSPGALIGVDEEGGVVTRLEASTGSNEPGNAVLGRVDDIGATRRSGRRIGARVAAAGIDIDLAPVVDVNSDPRNPVIGVRSFGSRPDLVSRHAVAMTEGIQSMGVASCLKHFPGYGDVVIDPHLSVPTVVRTPGQFRSIHLPPFAAAVRAGAKCVMAAHVRVAGGDSRVASLDPDAMRPLRSDLGFDGVVICDALDMGAVSGTVGQARGAVMALLAGNDLLCIGNPVGHPGHDEDDFARVRDGIFEGLDRGDLPLGVVEGAVRRIDALSSWCRERRGMPLPMDADDHGEADDLARRALDIRADGPLSCAGTDVLLVDARSARSPVVGRAENRFLACLRDRGLDVVVPESGDRGDPESLLGRMRRHDGGVVLIVGSLIPGGEEEAFVSRILGIRPRAIVLQTEPPAQRRVASARMMLSYGDALPSARAVADVLAGNVSER